MADVKGIGADMAAASKGADRVKPTNRFINGIFGSIVIKAASVKAQVYEEGDRKSRKLANVLVELGKTGVFLKGNVKAIQNKGQAKPHAEFNFFAAMPQGSCIVVEDSVAGVEFESFKDHVVGIFGEWRKGNGTAVAVPADALMLDDVQL